MREVDPQYLTALPYYARHGQDRFLNDEVFHNQRGGTFVDLGAYDGVESSNTLFFEESLGWKGICVEPLPHIFPRLIKNRTSLCINKCAWNCTKKAPFLHVIPPPKPPGERRSNIEKMSGLIACIDEQHQQFLDQKVAEYKAKTAYFKVNCMSINDILFQMPSHTINLLSLDTEGSELDILEAIDMNLFFIRVIVIEVLFPNQRLDHWMREHSYQYLKTVGHDQIYLK